ncbi:MAG: enolase C-terminal domain-like protein [Planctomycetota bacterium]
MPKKTDIRVIGAEVYFLPVETRVPLKFGPETLTHVTCARVRTRVQDRQGNVADGWGETPLSVQWAWPSDLPYEDRHEAMKQFCVMLAEAWAGLAHRGHPLEIGCHFNEHILPRLQRKLNQKRGKKEAMPLLGALISCSAFDIACHDAYGNVVGRPVYETYCAGYMNRDLSHYLRPAKGSPVKFAKKYPCDFFLKDVPKQMPAWHLVGGKDLLDKSELTGGEPNDGYPVLLPDWIERDGLKCLKVKLRGNDAAWDYDRLVAVGKIAIAGGVDWLTSDFNCTVTDPAYVNGILDRLVREYPRIYGMILYVEQPFPYDLDKNRIDVHSVAARKPLFMDESAHDWRFVQMGRELGWTGVALKTCKTQSGALLSLCWAKAHGMTLMVQDLTNPMLAQVPHVLLAAHAGTIMGVETNAMQFYPEASKAEEAVHPGLYRRRNGNLDLSTVSGPGFGYRVKEIKRDLPEAAGAFGDIK